MVSQKLLVAAVFAVIATPAMAQAQSTAETDTPAPSDTAMDADDGDIVVTAQRRSQAIQDVPLAVSALDADALQAINANDITSLTSATPGISGVAQGVLQPIIAIRGISSNSFGIGGEASVGIFVDDAYVGRLSGSSVPFLDIERVEVLRGPQGSLYGRNSTAGAISIITNRPNPDERSLEFAGSWGRFDNYDASIIANVPVGESSAFRIAVQTRGDDGFDRNIVTGSRAQGLQQMYGGRLSLQTEIVSGLDLTARLAYSNEEAGAYPFKTIDPGLAAASGADTDPFSGRFAHELDGNETRETFGGNLTLNWALSDNFSIKSVTTFNRSRVESMYDIDGSALPLLRVDFSDGVSRTIGQELRFSYENGPLVLQFGGSGFFERIRDQRALNYDESLILPALGSAIFGTPDGSAPANALFPGSPAFSFCDATATAVLGIACMPIVTETIQQRGRYASYAIFADAELELTETLSAILSGRYSIDNKRFFFSTPLVPSQGSAVTGHNILLGGNTTGLSFDKSWRDFQPRAVLRWRPNRDFTAYASVTKGFKSGGFDPASDNINYSSALTQFEAERVWSYEVGIKADFADRMLSLDLASYRFNYRGFQTQILLNGITSTLNVPRYNGLGVEIDLTIRPNDTFTITLGGTWNDATFGTFLADDRSNPGDSVNLQGNRSVLAPEWSGFLRGNANIPLSPNLRLRTTVNATWRSEQFFSIYNDPRERQGSYALVDASLGIEAADNQWALNLVGQNLFDRDYLTLALDQGFGVVTARGRPRSFAVEGRLRF